MDLSYTLPSSTDLSYTAASVAIEHHEVPESVQHAVAAARRVAVAASEALDPDAKAAS